MVEQVHGPVSSIRIGPGAPWWDDARIGKDDSAVSDPNEQPADQSGELM